MYLTYILQVHTKKIMNPSQVIPPKTAEHTIPKMLSKPQANIKSANHSVIPDDCTTKQRGPVTVKQIIRSLAKPGESKNYLKLKKYEYQESPKKVRAEEYAAKSCNDSNSPKTSHGSSNTSYESPPSEIYEQDDDGSPPKSASPHASVSLTQTDKLSLKREIKDECSEEYQSYTKLKCVEENIATGENVSDTSLLNTQGHSSSPIIIDDVDVVEKPVARVKGIQRILTSLGHQIAQIKKMGYTKVDDDILPMMVTNSQCTSCKDVYSFMGRICISQSKRYIYVCRYCSQTCFSPPDLLEHITSAHPIT